jgi:predicted extracellular nuclease
VNLSGWSVQYAASGGTSWSVTNLSAVSLLPGRYYLIQESSGGAAGAALPTPDATGTITMAAGAGKVALVSTTTALSGSGCPFGGTVVDFVGYGTANCFEGAAAAPAPSNTTADIRAGGGCTDTDVNSTNFAAAAPTPRNTGSATNQCPGTITTEADGKPLLNWSEFIASLFERRILTSRATPWFLN